MVKEVEEVDVSTTTTIERQLILFNDEYNTFDWVIESLMEVCGHTSEQAHQCALIVHHRGKYTIRTGSFNDLRPECTGLTDRGLSAEVS